MADIRISDLTAATSVASTDLIVVSQDDGDTTFTSKKITGANFDMVKGLRYYGSSATDPVTPTPADGDEYYNTVLDRKMYYDAGRAKWLSIETITMYFGRNGNVTAGTYYRTINGLAYSSTNGFYLPWNVTIVGIGYTRNDTDSATFEVTSDGSSVATLSSTAIKGATTSLNVNSNSTSVLGVRNQSGGNTTTDAHGWVFLKWRI